MHPAVVLLHAAGLPDGVGKALRLPLLWVKVGLLLNV